MQYLNLPAKFRNRRHSGIVEMPVGEECVLMDVEGAGAIRHLWMTDSGMQCEDKSVDENYGRDVLLRVTFDHAEIPQVECPFDDFFGLSWRKPFRIADPEFCGIRSHYITLAPQRSGFNGYFPMPYAESAKITVEYQPAAKRNWWPHVYLQADIHEYDRRDFTESLRFHARWRRENPCPEFGEHFLLADIDRGGFLAGLSLGIKINSKSDAWYHAGGDFIYLDGEGDSRVLHGIGMEDLFGSSYGTAPFSAPYVGCPYYSREWVSFYRFFVEDLIRFERSCRVMIGGLGNDYSGVAYWYQDGSAPRYFNMPSPDKRLPDSPLPAGSCDTGVGKTAMWELVGPFPLKAPDAFDEEMGPETNFSGRCGEEWTLDDLSHRRYKVWARQYPPKKIQCLTKCSYHHFIDFNATPFRLGVGGICCGHHMAAFARRELDVPADMKTAVHLGFDDQMALYLDGKKLFKGEHMNGFRNVEVPVTLRRGKHQLLVKLSNFENSTWHSWAFCCRIKGLD